MIGPLFHELERQAESIDFARRSILFSSGDPCTGIYIVRSGRISLRWGRERTVYPFDSAGPGEVLGLPAALRGTYSATARAVEDAQIGFVSVDQVNRLLDGNPYLCRMALELVAHEIRRMRLLNIDISVAALPRPAIPGRQTGTALRDSLPIR